MSYGWHERYSHALAISFCTTASFALAVEDFVAGVDPPIQNAADLVDPVVLEQNMIRIVLMLRHFDDVVMSVYPLSIAPLRSWESMMSVLRHPKPL